MALIAKNHPAAGQDIKAYWEDERDNARICLFELEKAIHILTIDNKKAYSMDTGQTTINVTRQDLPSLIDRAERLAKYIEYLDEKLGDTLNGCSSKLIQAVPQW